MWNHWAVVTVRKTFARECIDRGRWLRSVSTCTADANDRIIRCGWTGVPIRTATSFRRNYQRLYDAWGTQVTNERCRIRSSRSNYPARFRANSIPLKFPERFLCPPLVEIVHRHSSKGLIAKCARLDAMAKSWPSWNDGKAFYFEEHAWGNDRTASLVECIMQRLFEVHPFRPFSRRLASLFLFLHCRPSSFFTFIRSLFRRDYRWRNATRTSRGSRETDISRYKRERFTAKWIDYSVSRSRQRRKERRLLARAHEQMRTILDRSFALLPRWKDGNRITLITAEIKKNPTYCFITLLAFCHRGFSSSSLFSLQRISFAFVLA